MKPKLRKALGLVLLLVPLSLIVAMTVDAVGWGKTILIWGSALVFAVCLAAGIRFLLDDP